MIRFLPLLPLLGGFYLVCIGEPIGYLVLAVGILLLAGLIWIYFCGYGIVLYTPRRQYERDRDYNLMFTYRMFDGMLLNRWKMSGTEEDYQAMIEHNKITDKFVKDCENKYGETFFHSGV